jgi:hypothetical protein
MREASPVRNGEEPIGAGKTVTSHTSQTKQEFRFKDFLPLLPIVVTVLSIVISNLGVSRQIRMVLFWLALIGGSIAFILLVLWANRQRSAGARWFAFTVLLLVAGITSIVPVVFLDVPERILFLKLGAVLFFSLLPGLLYLQFIAVKLGTLKDEFVANLHRLRIDTYENLPAPAPGSVFFRPERHSSPEDTNVYVRKFEALYGQTVSDGDRSEPTITFKASALLPLIYTTILLAVGWAMALTPEIIPGPHLRLGSFELLGRPVLAGDALRFGFAGAYYYILQTLVRRYFQDDLRNTAYINATWRIIIVALLVTAVNAAMELTPAQAAASAFVIGIFPQVALKALQTIVSKLFKGPVPSLDSPYPLSDLDGLNIWYETRLLEEGVEDMQNLATANLVDVMLRTRVPVERLVDWVDQAHLYIRVAGDDGRGNREQQRLTSSRAKLRRLGIRTATDLEDVFGRQLSLEVENELVNRLLLVLDEPSDGQTPAAPSATASILRSLRREPNLWHVAQWKAYTGELEATRSPVQMEERAQAAADHRPPTGSAGPSAS